MFDLGRAQPLSIRREESAQSRSAQGDPREDTPRTRVQTLVLVGDISPPLDIRTNFFLHIVSRASGLSSPGIMIYCPRSRVPEHT